MGLTPSWEKASWQKHDSGSPEARVETGPAPKDGKPTVPTDTGSSTPAIDAGDRSEGSPQLDAQGDSVRSEPVASADVLTPQPDTRVDASTRPLDSGTEGGFDSSGDVSEPVSEDAPRKVDRVPILDSLVPDTRVLDLAKDTTSLPSRGLVAYYPCENANGTRLADTSGKRQDAILANSSGATPPAGFTFAAGKVGNGLIFSAKDKAYVSLPSGIVSKLSQVTIATWVKLNVNTAFQRLFDFAVSTDTFMYLTNAGIDGHVRFRISAYPLGKDQAVDGSGGLPVGAWVHAAVTLGADGVSIFVNGARVGQQASAALRPSDLGETTNNYIGRSQFTADPYLDGQIDEFRIYDRVLSSAEIAELASGR